MLLHYSTHPLERLYSFRVIYLLPPIYPLYQWQLWQTEERSNEGGLQSNLENQCYKAFTSREPTVSKLQQDVVSVLTSVGLQPKEEVVMRSGYSLDALVEVNGREVEIEVDGPSHFVGRKPTGSTTLKRRQIASVEGVALVSIPYWEWNELGRGRNNKRAYLWAQLEVCTCK